MRIAVDLRILVVGKRSINRGMGRFTQQQLSAVLALDHENDYVVLCDPTADLSLLAPGIRAAENAYVRIPPAWAQGPSDGFASTLRRGEEFQHWLGTLDVSLYHSATPFLLWEPLVPQFDACPVVATLYDLIPLVYPGHYLSDGHEGPYFRALEMVKRADRLLAISQSAKRDAELYLGVPQKRIDVAYPSADEVFRPMRRELAHGILARWGPVPDTFALAVSAFHASKNVQVLLEAYAALPERARIHLPLLLGGHFEPVEQVMVNEIAARLGISDDLVLVGVIRDEELAALYSCASVVVHPSRYEGFGYPVLEAMACGAPVITTTSSSLPEVAGDAALLVDPDDVDGLSSALQQIAADSELRLHMSRRGLERAALFSCSALGEATLRCYERTAGRGIGPSAVGGPARRLRVAMWTPLPPLQTGIADYAVELMQGLDRSVEIEVFVEDGFLPELTTLQRLRVYHEAAFERRHAQRPFDVSIYQMGNSRFHGYIYEQLRRHPGIVVLHDLGVSPILFDSCYASGDFEPFLRELAHVEGESVRSGFAERFGALSGEARDAYAVEFLRNHPLLRSVADSAQALIVHTEAAARKLRSECPEANVSVVGMGVSTPGWSPGGVGRHQARRARGYRPSTFVVSAFGIVHPTKCIEQCIRALADVIDEHPDMLLVVVGRSLSSDYERELIQTARTLGVADRVRFRGHLPRTEFDAELVSCDAVVNLRAPFASHMSAVLMRALGAGKPVVMSDLADWAAIPRDACLRVPDGAEEIAVLAQHLSALAGRPDLRSRLSEAARSWFLRNGTVASMAEGYRKVMHDVWIDSAALRHGALPSGRSAGAA